MFYGMPIHIIRDVALTIRSFYKRITDFIRYRQATQDMNARYPDATTEEVAREDVCIICREDMRPWQQLNAPGTPPNDNAGAAHAASTPIDERLRPKKLPCGHVLHFACLRSWLERQQNCPTCRRPVLVVGPVTRVQDQAPVNPHGRAQAQPPLPPAPLPVQGNLQPPVAAQNVINLGPLRIAFGARQIPGQPQQVNNDPHPPHQQGPVPLRGQAPRTANALGNQRPAPDAGPRAFASFSPTSLQSQLQQIEQQLIREINDLQTQQYQLQLVRALQGELVRLRIAQANTNTQLNEVPSLVRQDVVGNMAPRYVPSSNHSGIFSQQQGFSTGHQNLPSGVTLPPGWTILPLQRLEDLGSTDATESRDFGTIEARSQSLNTSTPEISSMQQERAPANSRSATSPPHPPSSSGESLQTKNAKATFNTNDSSDQNHREHINGAEHSSSDESILEVPRRGTVADFPSGNGHQRPIVHESTGRRLSVRDPSANSVQSKGKGRASTVEDPPEGLD